MHARTPEVYRRPEPMPVSTAVTTGRPVVNLAFRRPPGRRTLACRWSSRLNRHS